MSIRIQTIKLSKKFKTHIALDEIDIEINRPQCIGLIGENGAGKSTLLRLLSGADFPSSGAVLINGNSKVCNKEKLKAMIGYSPEYPPIYPDMCVEEYMMWIAQMQRVTDYSCVEGVLKGLELWEVRSRQIGSLSKGLKQRVGFAQAWIHDPRIVLLDEPTSSLDPHQQQIVLNWIRQHAPQKIVILSSHQLGDLHTVCDRIIILKKGKMVLDMTADDIRQNNIELADFFR